MPIDTMTASDEQAVPHAVCEFCTVIFVPRVQTRKPRACPQDCCQKKRQKLNQKEWRQRERPHYPPSYHRDKRRDRLIKCRAVAAILWELLLIGAKLKNQAIDAALVEASLGDFVKSLGWRLAKKLCPDLGLESKKGFVPI